MHPSTPPIPTSTHRLKKSALWGAGLLLVLSICLAGGGYWYLNRSLPHYEGEVVLPHVQSVVRVAYDTYGVPHIFAETKNDAARVLGYVHARERMFQMELQRRAGQGRLAEVFGADMLGIDKFVRTLGLYILAEGSFAAFSSEAQDYFRAYAQGVNAWLDAHRDKLPLEFALLDLTPEAWKPQDSVVWGKLMALQLSQNYKLELLRAQLAQTMTPAMMQALFPVMPIPSPVTMAPHSALPLPEQKADTHSDGGVPSVTSVFKTEVSVIPSALDGLGKITSLNHAASNEWVIAGSRTVSGKPILANDPHLELGAPILWYLARIVTPDWWMKGATVPGIPIVLLGQNDRIAWGFTTTNSDTQDLFIETVDPKNSDAYVTPLGTEPFTVREEIIHVKGAADSVLRVRATRHGPVLSDIDAVMAKVAGEGKVMALSFPALSADDITSESLMHLNRARNWQDFTQALQNFRGPTQNIVYADRDGHIGFINPGYVPVRMKGEGQIPVDGASGSYDWRGMVPFSQVPTLYDPKAGFVFNANNQVTSSGINPYVFSHDWDEPYRARRLQHFFDTIAQHSLDSSAMMQNDTVSIVVAELLPYLILQEPVTAQARDALTMLKAWDRRMDKSSAAALIFEAWLYQLHQKIIVKHAGAVDVQDKGPYGASALNAILNANDVAWCGAGGCGHVVTDAFNDALAMLRARHGNDMAEWRWGDEHISSLQHKVFSHVPVLKWWSDLSVPSDGGFYTLNRGESADVKDEQPFLRRHAGGYRGLYDLGNPELSRFMIATGQSGHIFSRHYGDMVPLWNAGQYITLSGTIDILKAQGAQEMTFVPVQ